MKVDVRKEPRAQIAWGWYNWGRLVGIAHTRKGAIKEIEEQTSKPWAEARAFMEVHKVRIERFVP